MFSLTGLQRDPLENVGIYLVSNTFTIPTKCNHCIIKNVFEREQEGCGEYALADLGSNTWLDKESKS